MPVKRVHFAPENITYSPTPPTPSPTFSEISLPDSNGPMTPPNIKSRRLGSPYSCNPLPPADVNATAGCYPTGSVTIHPILAPGPAINYDLTLDLHSITTATSKRGSLISLPSHILGEPATYPPLPSMTLRIRGFHWPINVLPSTGKPNSCVTVRDVLHALYRSLRTPVTSGEYSSLLSVKEQSLVADAYERRYERYSGDANAYQMEKMKGLKRVDFLAGRARFLGLSWTTAGPDVWEVHVS